MIKICFIPGSRWYHYVRAVEELVDALCGGNMFLLNDIETNIHLYFILLEISLIFPGRWSTPSTGPPISIMAPYWRRSHWFSPSSSTPSTASPSHGPVDGGLHHRPPLCLRRRHHHRRLLLRQGPAVKIVGSFNFKMWEAQCNRNY